MVTAKDLFTGVRTSQDRDPKNMVMARKLVVTIAPTGAYLSDDHDADPVECVVGVTVGGHNWLPVTVEAIMLGADCVRVGMEDTIWMYPHKDDIIERCADLVTKVANIAREPGREVATPAEAKKILGL